MRVFALLLALFSLQAGAQTTAQQIVATSPQLVSFAGSDANLQSLVNGLALGQAITLVTTGSDGLLQIATFTPPSALGNGVSSALEQARTALIARGISQPTAQQVAVALMGGTILTTGGQLQIPGVLTGTSNTTGVAVRNEFAGSFTGGATPFGSVANFQALSNGLRQGTPITLSGNVNGVPQTVTFTAPGGAVTAADANQLLILANQSLLSLGIVNPTPAQIQTALLGGTLPVPGGSIALQGVLQNRTVNTSTSNLFGTSNSPTVPAPVIGSPNISSGAGTTSIPAPIVGSTPSIGGIDGARRANTAEGANRGVIIGR
jgi:hypothetical protein